MSGGWEERFYAAVRDYIDGRNDGPYGSGGKIVEAAEVTYIGQTTQADGYCDTCYYEYTVLEISYIEKGTGRSRLFTYRGDMGDLLRELG